MYEDSDYYPPIINEHGMERCKEITTPSPQQPINSPDPADLVDDENHSPYRRTVGNLRWQVPAITYITFSTHGLAICLNAPTEKHFTTLKTSASIH